MIEKINEFKADCKLIDKFNEMIKEINSLRRKLDKHTRPD